MLFLFPLLVSDLLGKSNAILLTRMLHEKREKAWRDREPERVVKPEPDNSVIAVRILQILYGRGIAAI